MGGGEGGGGDLLGGVLGGAALEAGAGEMEGGGRFGVGGHGKSQGKCQCLGKQELEETHGMGEEVAIIARNIMVLVINRRIEKRNYIVFSESHDASL